MRWAVTVGAAQISEVAPTALALVYDRCAPCHGAAVPFTAVPFIAVPFIAAVAECFVL